jgi:hypothetical protein
MVSLKLSSTPIAGQHSHYVAGEKLMTSRFIYTRASALTMLMALTAASARAQGYPFSQRGSVTQMVAFTNISVAYGRPVARGRVLFGALVPWDSVWHPGADSATRSRDFQSSRARVSQAISRRGIRCAQGRGDA